MRTVNEEEVVKKIDVHTIVCDECGKEIGRFEENEDCCINYGPYTRRVNISGNNLIYRKDLCEECAMKKDNEINEIIESLKNIGFTKDRY